MFNVKRLAFDALLAAVYFALSYLVLPLGGGLQLRFTSLALIVAALLFGPADACAVALVGETLYQTLLFGITATTPIWVLPPVLHAAFLGFGALLLHKRHAAEASAPAFYALCLAGGLLNTLLNTAALYADSRIMGYYTPALVFGLGLWRVLLGLVTAAVVATIALPPVRALRKRRDI